MGLLEHVQAEIEKRGLSEGGWSIGSRRNAGIETTCYALMALHDRRSLARDRGMDLLVRTQNPDGSLPAFEGDDRSGCWTTALVAIALRFLGAQTIPTERATRWLLDNKGREGHWFWKWKFRTVDRAVQFNPDKYGWPMFDLAQGDGIVAKHPALILFTPRECKRPDHRSMTMKEVQDVLKLLDLRERLIVKLAVLAGMRPGEIFGLRRGRVGECSVKIQERQNRFRKTTPSGGTSGRNWRRLDTDGSIFT